MGLVSLGWCCRTLCAVHHRRREELVIGAVTHVAHGRTLAAVILSMACISWICLYGYVCLGPQLNAAVAFEVVLMLEGLGP